MYNQLTFLLGDLRTIKGIKDNISLPDMGLVFNIFNLDYENTKFKNSIRFQDKRKYSVQTKFETKFLVSVAFGPIFLSFTN